MGRKSNVFSHCQPDSSLNVPYERPVPCLINTSSSSSSSWSHRQGLIRFTLGIEMPSPRSKTLTWWIQAALISDNPKPPCCRRNHACCLVRTQSILGLSEYKFDINNVEVQSVDDLHVEMEANSQPQMAHWRTACLMRRNCNLSLTPSGADLESGC